MKKILSSGIIASVFLLGIGNSAYADYSQTTVGVNDTLVHWAKLANQGEDTELAFINDYLDSHYTKAQYVQYTDMNAWQKVTNIDWWAYDLHKDGGYFLVKIGNIKYYDSNNNSHAAPDELLDTFLYKNLASTNYGVIDYSILYGVVDGALKNIDATYTLASFDFGKISHVGEFCAPVPVPSTALLLGSSLLGLVGFNSRRRRD
jgi:hypothetical protein